MPGGSTQFLNREAELSDVDEALDFVVEIVNEEVEVDSVLDLLWLRDTLQRQMMEPAVWRNKPMELRVGAKGCWLVIPESRREQQRRTLVEDILAEARSQLEAGGPAAVCLRGVGSAVGMSAPSTRLLVG